jgi:hypothetical protein
MRNIISAFLCFYVFGYYTSTSAQVTAADTIQWSGSEQNRVNIVILGDGYQLGELPKFASDARNITQALFNEEPYKTYASFFNVIALPTASVESGAARDPSMPIQNFYGSTFNFAGIDRLLVPTKNWQIQQVLASYFPAYDQVFMLVNDEKYGGSGGWVATSSTHTSAPEIAIHEIGHSFAKLSDEYFAGDQYLRETDNMTKETNAAQVKWKHWMGFGDVGIFQHCCGGNSSLWYRPHDNCKMRFLGRPFCPICKEATVRSIYRLVGMVDGFSPREASVKFEEIPIQFSVALCYPQPSSLLIEWFLDDGALPGYSGKDTLEMTPQEIPEGEYNLICSITDSTAYVRKEGFQSQVYQEIVWRVQKSTSNINILTAQHHTWDIKTFPNPTSSHLNYKLNKTVTGVLTAQWYAASGLLLETQQIKLLDENQGYLTVSELPKGLYTLVWRLDQRIIGSQLIQVD